MRKWCQTDRLHMKKALFVWAEVALRAVADWQTGSRPHSRFHPAAMAIAAEGCCHWFAPVQRLTDKCIPPRTRRQEVNFLKWEWKWASAEEVVLDKSHTDWHRKRGGRYLSPMRSCSPTPHDWRWRKHQTYCEVCVYYQRFFLFIKSRSALKRPGSETMHQILISCQAEVE